MASMSQTVNVYQRLIGKSRTNGQNLPSKLFDLSLCDDSALLSLFPNRLVHVEWINPTDLPHRYHLQQDLIFRYFSASSPPSTRFITSINEKTQCEVPFTIAKLVNINYHFIVVYDTYNIL